MPPRNAEEAARRRSREPDEKLRRRSTRDNSNGTDDGEDEEEEATAGEPPMREDHEELITLEQLRRLATDRPGITLSDAIAELSSAPTTGEGTSVVAMVAAAPQRTAIASARERLDANLLALQGEDISMTLREEMLKLVNPGFNEVNGTAVTFADVHGADKVKEEAADFFAAVDNPMAWTGAAKPRRCLILEGKPGTGKTSAVRALITQALEQEKKFTFFVAEREHLVVSDVNKTCEKLKALFAVARALAPSIIFVDECHALLHQRGGARTDCLKNLITTLMAAQNCNVLFVGATNKRHEIDEALLSRLGDSIKLEVPTGEEGETWRRRVLETALKSNTYTLHGNEPEDDWLEILKRTNGCDGRWLADHLVAKAARIAARDGGRPITIHDFRMVLASAPHAPAAAPATAAAPASTAATRTPEEAAKIEAAREAVTSDKKQMLEDIIAYQGEGGMRAVRFHHLDQGGKRVWLLCDNPECCGKLEPAEQLFAMEIPAPSVKLSARLNEAHRKWKKKHDK